MIKWISMAVALALLGWWGLTSSAGDALEDSLEAHCQAIMDGEGEALPMDSGLEHRFQRIRSRLLALSFALEEKRPEFARGRFHFNCSDEAIDSGDIPFVATWKQDQWWLEVAP
ncbi:MAG: hypothetical protein AB7F75_02525 [Planctomycetota bacterium]